MKDKIRISIVNYANTLPFRWALRHSELLSRIDLQEDMPSICAQKLKSGQVDLALVPVALIPELDSYIVQSRFCIGAVGKVDSVKLYSQVPLEQIAVIVLDYQSRTSVNLARVLSREHWKISPRFEEARPGFEENIKGDRAAVVIGDRTFALNGKFNYELDLAEEWFTFTNLPFVFAAWLSVNELPAGFMQEFDAVLQHGIDHIPASVKEMGDLKQVSRDKLIDYLENYISYELDAGKKEGLQRFLAYLR